VKVEGLRHIDSGLAQGKGVIALSAHIGNWELGGQVLGQLRKPVQAVVLTHQNKKINDFFNKQRSIGKLMPIEMGMSLRVCYITLKNNGLLALLGDRDFSKNGLKINFFGRTMLMPRGPAVLSQRLGAPVVPCFMIREPDDTFKFIMEPPIFPETGKSEEEAVESLTNKYSAVIEKYVKIYPEQWYVFRDAWGNNEKNMQSDTVI
jgi:KDO2-lipid IV(A) lauroyltransferase